MKRFLLYFHFLGLIISVMSSSAQELNEYGFDIWTKLPVRVNGIEMLNPWAGGLNNVQLGMMDLNNDGIEDLLLFDRHGERLLPFIYVPDLQEYVFSPGYRQYFPPLKQWVQWVDYNHDGFPDIFTYTPGGIMIYKNKGVFPPAFEKAVDPYLTSLQGSIYTNLLVTNVDYPAIVDLDGDGDYDILTFWGLGSFVEFHTNLSMETTGRADSLLFKRTQVCWGEFAENPESNIIYLDTCLSRSSVADPKHTGSTFCLIDLNGDKVLDLLLGDVDYPEPAVLINGGDNVMARMVEQWGAFPLDYPIKLWSFPLIQYLDVLHSGKPQLLASPFDPSLVKSAGQESLWLYENLSNTTVPEFALQTKSFLQEGMIDLGLGAYPVFADLNGNGLKDLIVSNYGSLDTCVYNVNMQLKCHYSSSIHLFENTGTAQQPVYALIDDDFANISTFLWESVYTAFADLDADGDMDMLVGESTGTIWYFENLAGPGQWPVFAAPQPEPWGVKGPEFATPQLVDLDGDGDFDLVMGGKNGSLSYFKNTGTPSSPMFEKISERYGGVNVTDSTASYSGYSVPCFFKNPQNEWVLMVGSESGNLFYFKDIHTDGMTAFTLESKHFMYITEGIRTAPALSDINADGYIDLAIGNYSGGVVMYKGSSPGPAGLDEIITGERLILSPNPSNDKVSIRMPEFNTWTVEMITTQGKVVALMQLTHGDKAEVDLTGVKPGLYLVRAIAGKGPYRLLTSKLVVIQ